jgi:hypothetical protein
MLKESASLPARRQRSHWADYAGSRRQRQRAVNHERAGIGPFVAFHAPQVAPMSLEVPNAYLELAPVIVTAPTARCGTTLIQRLLTSSVNAFIYGEEIAAYMASLTQVMVSFLQLCDKLGPRMDADYAEALAGPPVNWCPGLMPPAAVIRPAWVATYYQIPFALAHHGQAIGRPIFGFKRPDLSRDMLKALLMMLPKARVIYVFRNLEDALKSAKARRFVTTEADVAAFCTKWATNIQEATELASDPRVMFLRYERLADREAVVHELEAFSGARGVKAEVFDARTNTFVGAEQDGHSPTQYIEPAPLTSADRDAIARLAGPLIAKLYGSGAPITTAA